VAGLCVVSGRSGVSGWFHQTNFACLISITFILAVDKSFLSPDGGTTTLEAYCGFPLQDNRFGHHQSRHFAGYLYTTLTNIHPKIAAKISNITIDLVSL
jgi:hypothetical protein